MWKVNFLAVTLLLLAFVRDSKSWWARRRRPSRQCSRRDCKVSVWSKWSPCSHKCGTNGMQKRTRTKTVVEACGGTCPFVLSQTQPCNRDKCQNSGTPTSSGCSCPPGYQGMCCEIATTGPPVTNSPPVHLANFLSFNNGKCNVSWMYNSSTDRLHFVTEVMTTGWVGFGFATQAPNNMFGYDVAVGGVLNGVGYLRDYYTTGFQQPSLDAVQDWIMTYSREENGITTLAFYRQRNTNDQRDDVAIQPGVPIFLIWAYHPTADAIRPDFFPFHGYGSRGFQSATLIPSITTPSTPGVPNTPTPPRPTSNINATITPTATVTTPPPASS